ncbi:MAG TPA: hypothetical protein VFF27_14090 [Bacteroidia bacterium]|jgi:hypothetical protein|nr:hypothetical protein [Bacteroidia bacterium]
MKKKLLIIVPALVFGLSTFAHEANGGNEKQQTAQSVLEVNQSINEAVKQQLSSFLEGIPVGMEAGHGFKDRSEFAKATPASIYKIVGVDQSGNLFETGLYNVVIAVNDEYRAVLSVSSANGKYEIESVGGAELSKQIKSVEEANTENLTKEKVIVNVYSKTAGFISYKEFNSSIENATLIPLGSAKLAMGEENERTAKAAYTFSEAMHAIALN